MKIMLLPLLVAVAVTTAAFSQCTDSTTYRYDSSSVTRPNGNEVDGYGQSQVFGNYQYWWKLYLDSTWTLQNGPTLGHNTYDTADPGVTVWRRYWTTLQAYGPGTYALSNTHNAWNVYCSYWDNPTVTGDQKTVSRPTVTMDHPIWYLGGYGGFANYNTAGVLTADPKGAPETPAWVVEGQPQKVQLSCSQCTQASITALQPSNGQNSTMIASCTYDIVVHASVNGFLSDAYWIYIGTPWKMTYVTRNDLATSPVGWQSTLSYQLLDACTNPLSGMRGGEKLVSAWASDMANNWADAAQGPTSENPSAVWTDILQMTSNGCKDQNGQVIQCQPAVMVPQCPPSGCAGAEPSGRTAVKHIAQEVWMGSYVTGGGVRVYTDTIQFYTDHGAYLNFTSPNHTH